MRKDASQIIYDEVSLLGHPALLTGWRVDQTTIPDGFHRYELRHADEDGGDPCQLAKRILVNFYGSILTLHPLQLPAHGYLDVGRKDLIHMGDNSCATLGAFLQKYSQKEV